MAESRERREDRQREDFSARVTGESNGSGERVKPTQAERDAELIRVMQERFERGSDLGADNLERARKDDRFVLGLNQWAGAEGRQNNPDRATLTINKLPPKLHNITNKIRQHQPAPDFEPNDKGHPETARLFQSLWRKVNHDSKGNLRRGDAFEQAARGGYGYYYMDVDWAADQGFEQCIAIRGQPNRSAVVDDWSCREPDFSDRRFLFLVEEITEKEFKDEHPHNNPGTGTGLGKNLLGYFQGRDSEARTLPRITYWRRQLVGWKKVTRTVKAFAPEGIEWAEDMGPLEAERTEERMIPVEWIYWCQTNGTEVLKDTKDQRIEGVLPIPWIPWFMVPAWQVNLDGKWHLEGATHQAQGATISYNYAASTMAEALGMAPKAQWTGDARLWTGYENIWDNAHRTPVGRLPYNAVVHGGVLVKPEMVNPPPPPNLALAMQQAAEKDLNDTTGVFGEAVGEASNDPSGYARNLRRTDVTDNHWHLLANLAMAEEFEGRCFLALAPHVYGEQSRMLKLLGPDNRQYQQTVNEPQPVPGEQVAYWTTYGVDNQPVEHFSLLVGSYDVHVKAGTNWATEREQTRDALEQLMTANPAAGQFVAPYYVKMLGMEDGEAIADLLVATWPPNLQEIYYSEDPSDKATVSMLRGQLAQLQPAYQQLMQQVQILTTEVDDKKREAAVKVFDTMARTFTERLETIGTIATKRMESQTKLAVEEMRIRNSHAADDTQALVQQVGTTAEQAVGATPTPEPPELQAQRAKDMQEQMAQSGGPAGPGAAPGAAGAPGGGGPGGPPQQ